MSRKFSVFTMTLALLTGLACEDPDARRPPIPGGVSTSCERGDGDDVFLPFGFLGSAQYWGCNLPRAGNARMAFSGHTGVATSVTGGSISLNFEWTGGDEIFGHMVVLGFQGQRGYWVFYPDSNDNPLKAEFFVDRGARGGLYNMVLYIDDGTGTPEEPSVGAAYLLPFNVIGVGSGDIQVSLSWDTLTDVDLHVFTPASEHIYYGNRSDSTGGQLDLDSNPSCSFDNVNNENIFWGEGRAPVGEYRVVADLWSDCGTLASEVTTHWRATILTSDGQFDVFEGEFSPGMPDDGIDSAEDGSSVDDSEITRFFY